MNLIFSTLFYFASVEHNSQNIKVYSDNDLHITLARNLNALSRSLDTCGYRLRVFTNDAHRVRSLTGSADGLLDVVELNSEFQPPEGIRFHSAHHKLQVIKEVARQSSILHAIVDLDMVALRPIPAPVIEMASSGAICVYDISTQIFGSVDAQRVLVDLQKLDERLVKSQWFGGEFILARGDKLDLLSQEFGHLWARYSLLWKQLHHQGDEAITSAALGLLQLRGENLVDLGYVRIVRRYWSIATDHTQEPLGDLGDLSMLHLPADKFFLANYSHVMSFTPRICFVFCYKIFATAKRTASCFKRLLKRQGISKP